MRAVVFTFDRLPLNSLGCYGNEWIETPNLDRLASRSVVFDRHYGENFDAAAANHAWWTGCFQFARPLDEQLEMTTIANQLRKIGVSGQLLVEKAAGAAIGPLPPFDFVEEIAGVDGLEIDDNQTPLARLVERSIESLDQLCSHGDRPWLLWLKSRGVPDPCVVPQAFASLYAGELENLSQAANPVPADSGFESSSLPTCTPGESYTARRVAHAGYITFIDHWLGKLLDHFDEFVHDETSLLILAAGSGVLIAERDWQDPDTCPLSEELVNTPLIVQSERTCDLGERNQALVQSVDLVPTLLDFFSPDSADIPGEGRSLMPIIRGEEYRQRDFVCLGDSMGNRAIRTQGLYMVETPEKTASNETVAAVRRLLYAKPEDVWDTSNLANQAPDDVSALATILKQFTEQARGPVPIALSGFGHKLNR